MLDAKLTYGWKDFEIYVQVIILFSATTILSAVFQPIK